MHAWCRRFPRANWSTNVLRNFAPVTKARTSDGLYRRTVGTLKHVQSERFSWGERKEGERKNTQGLGHVWIAFIAGTSRALLPPYRPRDACYACGPVRKNHIVPQCAFVCVYNALLNILHIFIPKVLECCKPITASYYRYKRYLQDYRPKLFPVSRATTSTRTAVLQRMFALPCVCTDIVQQ